MFYLLFVMIVLLFQHFDLQYYLFVLLLRNFIRKRPSPYAGDRQIDTTEAAGHTRSHGNNLRNPAGGRPPKPHKARPRAVDVFPPIHHTPPSQTFPSLTLLERITLQQDQNGIVLT
jgi:hypothetical protein